MMRTRRSPRGGLSFVRRASLALLFVPPAVSAQPSVPVSLGSSPSEIRFRVPFDDPSPAELTVGENRLRSLRWPGLSLYGDPGELRLPVVVVRVALPPRGEVTLAERPEDGGTARDVHFPTEPGIERGRGRTESGIELPLRHAKILAIGIERGLRIATVAVEPMRRGSRAGEAVWARAIEVTLQVRGASAERPRGAVPRDPTAERFWARTLVNPDAVAAFRVAAPPPPPPPGGIPSAWFDDAAGWAKLEIQTDGITSVSRSALDAAGVPVATLDPRTLRVFAGPLVPELPWTNLGWDTVIAGPDTALTEKWRHVYERPGFAGGFEDAGAIQEIAIFVPGEGDGAFDAGDRVVFYSLGPDNYRDRFGLPPAAEPYIQNPYTDRTVYWLAWGGSISAPPLRMATVDAFPVSATPVVVSGTARVHAEQNTLYLPSFVAPGMRTENWFWDVLSTQSAGLRFTVALPRAVPFSSLEAQVRFWGGNIPNEDGAGPDTLHHVQVDVNGQGAGLFTWGGTSFTTALTPRDVFVNGIPVSNPSEFIFRVPQVGSNPGRLDQLYLAWIDVSYHASLAFAGVGGEVAFDPGPAGRTLHLSLVPEGSVLAYDVSDPRRPRRLQNGLAGGSAGSRTLEVAVDSPEGGTIALEDPAAPRAPASIVLDDPPRSSAGSVTWLRDTSEPLDYVIVAADPFAPEAEALAERRRAHLGGITDSRPARVRVVRISDIMDEFGGGMFDPTAIRHFLEYVSLYYGDPQVDDRLAYALFVGDHTYDFRNYSRAGTRSWVPSWEENRENIEDIGRSGPTQYASDDFLARFDGAGDPYTDLALGRLPVTSPAEARALIEDKILASETNPSYGPWRGRMLLAADDLCQLGAVDPAGGDGEFVGVIEDVDARFPFAFDREKVYLVEYGTSCSILSKPQAAADLKAAWSAGAWLVDYVGHGDTGYLADERILLAAEADALGNGPRLPLFIATASKAAKFNFPSATGIVEALVRSPSGGALAATGSTSNQTYSDVAFQLNRDFASRLFPGGDPADPAPMGLAFIEAKRMGFGVTDKYVFLGDPAQLPPVPGLAATVSAPDTLLRGGLADVRARVVPAGGRGGLLDLRAEEPRVSTPVGFTAYALPGDAMFAGTDRVEADSAGLGFTVPVGARTGNDAHVRAYAWGDDWDALGAVRLPVAGTADPGADVQGPAVAFLPHPGTLAPGQTLAGSLEDPSGIKLAAGASPPAVELVVRDAGGGEVARLPLTGSFAYDLGSHTQGTVRFPVPDLADGRYGFALAAEDNYGNRASVETEIAVSAGAAGVSFTEVYAYPNPMESVTDLVFTLDREVPVTVRIFSVSGRTVRRAELNGSPGRNGYRWDGRDQAGDPVANGVYLVQLSATAAKDPVRHLERLVVLR